MERHSIVLLQISAICQEQLYSQTGNEADQFPSEGSWSDVLKLLCSGSQTMSILEPLEYNSLMFDQLEAPN